MYRLTSDRYLARLWLIPPNKCRGANTVLGFGFLRFRGEDFPVVITTVRECLAKSGISDLQKSIVECRV